MSFDKDALTQRLRALPRTSRVAFASACAARMATPHRQAVAMASLGDANVIDDALDQLARFLGSGARYVDWSGLAEQFVTNIPGEDEMASLASQVLDDALASTA